MAIKFLLLIGVFFVIYIIFFKKSKKEIPTGKKRSKKVPPEGDIMMECAKCETFVGEDDAIIKDGKFYCSKECAGIR